MNLEEALQRTAELEAENQALRSRLAEIERRLGLDSQTRSKPPSGEGFGKALRRTQSLRGKSKRANGGQLEYVGATLEAVSEPEHVVLHPVADYCPECGGDLKEQPVSKLVSEVLKDLFHCSLSPGTLATITDALSAAFSAALSADLSASSERIAARVKAASVKHLDETGLWIVGKTQWLHGVSTLADTWYRTSPTRKELSQLYDIEGVVVHDHWKSYFQLNGVRHSLCNALSTFEQEGWASAMARMLHLACHLKHRYGQGIPPPYKPGYS